MQGTVITKKGLQLLAKLISSEAVLVFTRAAVGVGKLPGGYDPAGMLDLNIYKMDGLISSCEASGDEASVVFQICSIGVESGFIITEAGLYAQDPDEGEILYAYIDLSSDPQYIYPQNSTISKFVEMTLTVVIGTVERVTATINPGSLITREQFEEEIEKRVAAAGGDVSETITGIQQPKEETEYPEFEEPAKLKDILGIIQKWVKVFDNGIMRS